MKKLGFTIILLSVLIASCDSDKESDKYRIDAGFVPYSGIAWNDSSEKVIEKMEAFADQQEYQYGFENGEGDLLYKVRDGYKSSFWLFSFHENKLGFMAYGYQPRTAILDYVEFTSVYEALGLSDSNRIDLTNWRKINGNCEVWFVHQSTPSESMGIKNICLGVYYYRTLFE